MSDISPDSSPFSFPSSANLLDAMLQDMQTKSLAHILLGHSNRSRDVSSGSSSQKGGESDSEDSAPFVDAASIGANYIDPELRDCSPFLESVAMASSSRNQYRYALHEGTLPYFTLSDIASSESNNLSTSNESNDEENDIGDAEEGDEDGSVEEEEYDSSYNDMNADDDELLLLEGDELTYGSLSSRRFNTYKNQRETPNIQWKPGISSAVGGDLPEEYLRPLSNRVPRNAIGFHIMHPGPHHINTVPKEEELIHNEGNRLASEMVLQDARRLHNAHLILNRVVFDCVEESPAVANHIDDIGAVTPGGPALTSKDGFNIGVCEVPWLRDRQWPPQDRAHVPKFRPYYTLTNESDSTLLFESRFESGNLHRAVQIYDTEYDLILKFDVNTRGHTQWYYFSVSNMRRGVKYKFNIINMIKPDSLYNAGMKPLVYSEYEAKHSGRGWHRDGTEICYYQNNIRRKNGYFYTFTWCHEFEHDNDNVYFAYCYPYTYTNLQNYLSNLEKDPVRRKVLRRRVLCQTLDGNNCDLLTITSFSGDPQVVQKRKGVVFSARVHPGESNASWMMKGIIDFLTGPSLDAKILRDNFVFKIVPMLNPDGVINGNYRCSLAGCDLNRRWANPSKKIHPTIFHTKLMIKRFMIDREMVLYCDIHGHSRKKNIFMYGCSSKNNPQSRIQVRIFPRLLWKNSQNFSFQDCHFKVQKSKESTARVVMSHEFGISNSFTMEGSFCGSNCGRYADKHYNTRHLEKMGHSVCEVILDYCDPDQSRVRKVVEELELLFPDAEGVSDAWESAGSDDDSSEETLESAKQAMGKGRGKKKKTKKKKRKQQASSSSKKSKKTSNGSSDSRSLPSGRTLVKPSSADSYPPRSARSEQQRRPDPISDMKKRALIKTRSTPNLISRTDLDDSGVHKKEKKRKRHGNSSNSSNSIISGSNSDNYHIKPRKGQGHPPMETKPGIATESITWSRPKAMGNSRINDADEFREEIRRDRRKDIHITRKRTGSGHGNKNGNGVRRNDGGGKSSNGRRDDKNSTVDIGMVNDGIYSPSSTRRYTSSVLAVQSNKQVQALVPSVYRADIALRMQSTTESYTQSHYVTKKSAGLGLPRLQTSTRPPKLQTNTRQQQRQQQQQQYF